jgi:hypothetical protein
MDIKDINKKPVVKEWRSAGDTVDGKKAESVVKEIHAKGMEAKVVMRKITTGRYIYKVYEGVAV